MRQATRAFCRDEHHLEDVVDVFQAVFAPKFNEAAQPTPRQATFPALILIGYMRGGPLRFIFLLMARSAALYFVEKESSRPA
jgi:hypothetical protein